MFTSKPKDKSQYRKIIKEPVDMRFWQRIVLHRQKISKLIYNKQNILKF